MTDQKMPYSKAEYAYKFRSRGRKHSLGELGKSFSIIDHKAYQYYNTNSKLSSRENVANYVEHGKIISEFYKLAGEKLLEASGGIFLDNLGYFGIIQEMGKRVAHDRSDGSIRLNPKTDNIIYNIGYVPIDKSNLFKSWVFDYSFSTKVKNGLCKSLKSGKKYTFNASLFFNKLRRIGNDL